ncbi:membrane protein [Lachnospiraceae bacterium KM106-2]|nr:membrane protein [Lachnospiraceae bacterium KM106-2]
MKYLLRKKKITAICFLIFLAVFSIGNAVKELGKVTDTLKSETISVTSLGDTISKVESSINENMLGRYHFIEAFGYVQKLLDKNEINNFEVVKDQQGKLHYTYFTDKINDTTDLAGRMSNLQKRIKDKNCKLLYVMPPDKYIDGYTKFPTGIPYSMANQTADSFLKKLKAAGIDSIDFRNYLKESGIKMQDVFFNTDHHWKIQTAFWASSVFFEQLEKRYGEKIEKESYYSDLKNYNQITYANSFLGSMGRKIGRYYAGADDFTLIYPKFATNYQFDLHVGKGMKLTGRFEEALLATPVTRQTENPFDTDMYMTYMYGNQDFAHIQNKDNKGKGLNICIIKDSFAVPFAAFSSLRCDNVYLIDPRYYSKSIEKFINQTDLDYVIVMFSPQDLVDEFFTFGK